MGSVSRLELESVIVNGFCWSRSQSRSQQNFADSDSGPELQTNTGQQTMIWDERYVSPKNIERQEKEIGTVQMKLKHHLAIEFHLKKAIRDTYRSIAIAVLLC